MVECNYIAQKGDLELSDKIVDNEVTWNCPSNIAIIKYWGKHGIQLPSNASLSFTLQKSVSKILIRYTTRSENNNISFDLLFEGKKNTRFEERISKYLRSLLPVFPFLKQLHLSIDASNTFPHSAGIASSASGMGALALCFCTIEKQLFGTLENAAEFYKKASYIARLGSGSASRSIYGGVNTWGKIEGLPYTSDEFASPFTAGIHPIFNTYRDYILIVNSGPKSVSSSKGHSLMNNHPYSESRFKQATQRMKNLLIALKNGDEDSFSKITESEALSLHGLMMTSDPSYILMEPNTLKIIQKIKQFRKQEGINLCFTLDAGPNIHLLFPEKSENRINRFINNELLVYCEDNSYISDKTGKGPKQII